MKCRRIKRLGAGFHISISDGSKHPIHQMLTLPLAESGALGLQEALQWESGMSPVLVDSGNLVALFRRKVGQRFDLTGWY